MIKVKTLTGKEIEIDIEPNDTIERIKERVEEKEGIPPVQQRWVMAVLGGEPAGSPPELDLGKAIWRPCQKPWATLVGVSGLIKGLRHRSTSRAAHLAPACGYVGGLEQQMCGCAADELLLWVWQVSAVRSAAACG